MKNKVFPRTMLVDSYPSDTHGHPYNYEEDQAEGNYYRSAYLIEDAVDLTDFYESVANPSVHQDITEIPGLLPHEPRDKGMLKETIEKYETMIDWYIQREIGIEQEISMDGSGELGGQIYQSFEDSYAEDRQHQLDKIGLSLEDYEALSAFESAIEARTDKDDLPY